jgi:hypothetical protein
MAVKESKVCQVCGKVFYRNDLSPYHWDNKKFCSKDCKKKDRILSGRAIEQLYRWKESEKGKEYRKQKRLESVMQTTESQSIEKICFHCGKAFQRNGENNLSWGKKKYCSKDCADMEWKQSVKCKESNRQYGKSDKRKEVLKRYWQSSINHRLASLLRCRMRGALKNNTKIAHTLNLIGCTVDELRLHIEALFQPGMSWDNYGLSGWHIDHQVPISWFDLSIFDNQKLVFHYTNLRPLWAKDNLSKGAKHAV